ncbi:hypothetical protein AQPE_1473 [Aquipluma nitroreducens]|uniref:HTH cro/C1-type domain-containing protein n=1 Tax=Aquipluma nitroreducens TaxID=2010828 RepID=A0A5K7S7M6_9BACT|nr:helix-turn-helix transcriptional regulator [Aquipluma nitroreducens]BBE17324.1 hypothetical protein AQPE_1473 [Aquipluma nitroreducens]
MSNSTSGVGIYIDVIDSRKIQSRNNLEFQVNNLKEFFRENEEYGIFDIWKGLDEFMIISPDWEFAVKTVIKVQELLHPFEQRFVLTGFDNVETDKPIHEMDNKEFVMLADGMISLKKNKLYVEIVAKEYSGLLDSVSIILNALITLKNLFTPSQMDIYRQNKAGKSQKELAGTIKKSQQYISKTLNGIKAANLDVLEEKLYKVINYGIDKRNSV